MKSKGLPVNAQSLFSKLWPDVEIKDFSPFHTHKAYL